jgi:phosphoserine phosphatase RsbU/P
MTVKPQELLRSELEERRAVLNERIARTGSTEPAETTAKLRDLLDRIDDALHRMEIGTYGLCETCHDPVETDRLLADPFLRTCLDHLTREEQRALEQDLNLARRIQLALLPRQPLRHSGWNVAYHYQAAGSVSGDYCDVVLPEQEDGDSLVLLGDISGKGVAASILMSNLHATFRSLAGNGYTVEQLMARANRLFCQSAMTGHYATLTCIRASGDGGIDVANAGHCPALLFRGGEVVEVHATGVPLGLFCDSQYSSFQSRLESGDALLLYTDGFSEGQNGSGDEYGAERLATLFAGLCGKKPLDPSDVTSRCLRDLADFMAGARRTDDIALMVLARE